MFLPGLTLWQREMVRFLRQRNRVVGALVTPVVFWALLGSGLGRSGRSRPRSAARATGTSSFSLPARSC